MVNSGVLSNAKAKASRNRTLTPTMLFSRVRVLPIEPASNRCLLRKLASRCVPFV